MVMSIHRRAKLEEAETLLMQAEGIINEVQLEDRTFYESLSIEEQASDSGLLADRVASSLARVCDDLMDLIDTVDEAKQ